MTSTDCRAVVLTRSAVAGDSLRSRNEARSRVRSSASRAGDLRRDIWGSPFWSRGAARRPAASATSSHRLRSAGGGRPLNAAGALLDPATLVTLELPRPRRDNGRLIAHVRYIDGYGNVSLDAGHDDLAAVGLAADQAVQLELPAGRHRVVYGRTFADVGDGELLLYEDAERLLAVAVSHGNAAAQLGLAVDDELTIGP